MRKTRIHVLEDDDDIRNVIDLLLKDVGFDVQLSSSFAELKKNIKEAMPDLFLLDIMLPDGNGNDLCRDLKSDIFTKHIPVIIMSAQNNVEENGVGGPADDYISKPFDIYDVLERINTCIKNSSKDKSLAD